MAFISWIAADWGTSNLRLWAPDDSNRVTETRTAPCGMGGLQPDQFEPALLDLAGDLLPTGLVTPVLICGMAGARQGWAEAPYIAVPCPPAGTRARVVPTRDTRLDARILPGLSQADPADVMRGEETQIAGFLASSPDFDGAICLPGPHTKWVRVHEGRVVAFRTIMTGELFSLLGAHSVLRHSVQSGWDDDAFDQGVGDALSRPQTLMANLFSIRATSLLFDPVAGAGRGRLSGLLIGADLAAARDFWQTGAKVGAETGTETGAETGAILGDPKISRLYETALGGQGVQAQVEDAAQLTLAGLVAARKRLDWGTT